MTQTIEKLLIKQIPCASQFSKHTALGQVFLFLSRLDILGNQARPRTLVGKAFSSPPAALRGQIISFQGVEKETLSPFTGFLVCA